MLSVCLRWKRLKHVQSLTVGGVGGGGGVSEATGFSVDLLSTFGRNPTWSGPWEVRGCDI